jgi:long-chain acyl-CoA synthetase
MPTFYELFRECAQRWPDNVALEIQLRDRVESFTYAEARRMAESIGRWLTENGFQPGSRIAILADNHPRWITTYLGIIAAGCAAVPLDTAFHADQVAKLLKDSGASLVFCDARHLALGQKAVEEVSVQILLMDSAELRSAGQPGAAVPT